MKKLFLATVLVLLSNPVSAAVDCETIPSCEDLGYTYTASECSGFSSIRCFYDKSKYFCNPVTNNTNQCSDPNKVYGSVAVGAPADCYCKKDFVNVSGECKDGLTYCHAKNQLFVPVDTLGQSTCATCAGGKNLNKSTNTCVDCTTCPANSTYNATSKKCLCNVGTFYNNSTGACVGSTRTYYLVVGHSSNGTKMQIADLSSAKEYTATTVSNLLRSMMTTVSTLAENKPTIAHYNVIKEVLGSSMPNIGTPSSVGADCFLASDGMYNLRQNKSASYSSYTTPTQFLADSVLKNCVTSDKSKLGATILRINHVDGSSTNCGNATSTTSDGGGASGNTSGGTTLNNGYNVLNPNLDLTQVQQYEGGVVDMGGTSSSGTSTGTSTGSSSGNYEIVETPSLNDPLAGMTLTGGPSGSSGGGNICTPPITSSVVCLQCGYQFDATTGKCKTGTGTDSMYVAP